MRAEKPSFFTTAAQKVSSLFLVFFCLLTQSISYTYNSKNRLDTFLSVITVAHSIRVRVNLWGQCFFVVHDNLGAHTIQLDKAIIR
jgi:hypothetical protein